MLRPRPLQSSPPQRCCLVLLVLPQAVYKALPHRPSPFVHLDLDDVSVLKAAEAAGLVWPEHTAFGYTGAAQARLHLRQRLTQTLLRAGWQRRAARSARGEVALPIAVVAAAVRCS